MSAPTSPSPSMPVNDDVRTWMSEGAERTASDLPVVGDLPTWLEGTLLRNGAAGFGGGAARHYLDGSAMVHRFAFRGGRVDYTSRFLETGARAAMTEGRLGYREFASDPCRRFAEPVASMFSPRFTDNANVNIARLGKQFLALTETPLPVAFDPATLATLGVAVPRTPGRGVRSPTAHPHVDRATGDWTTTQVHFGPRCSTRIYERPGSGGRPRLLAKLPTDAPPYLHSFAVTARHVVLLEQPFRVRAMDLILDPRPFIEQYRWTPEDGTKIVVLDRASGAVLSRHQAPPWFVFHHVNAFDDGTEIVLDLCTYDGPGVVDALYFEQLARPEATMPTATLRRVRVRPATTGDAVETPLHDAPFEWPRVSQAVEGRRHHVAYGMGGRLDGPDGPEATVARIEPDSGETHTWSQPRTFPGEPVFVPRPGGTREDDGVVLSVVFDAEVGESFLLVLDGHDLSERARVIAPGRIPFGFHGDFFGDAPG